VAPDVAPAEVKAEAQWAGLSLQDPAEAASVPTVAIPPHTSQDSLAIRKPALNAAPQ